MDTRRIEGAIDTRRLASRCVAFVGCGAAAGCVRSLSRCGVGGFVLVDRDTVGPENVCRQEHFPDQAGMPKVEALAAELRRINPAVVVRTAFTDVCAVPDAEADELFLGVDLFVAATDSHAAQARVNELALRTRTPAVWAGLYRGGRAGDVAYWLPGLPCYRCLFPTRYAAAARGEPDPPSDGATVLDVNLFDAVAAQVAVGLLTRGADNRFGRLLDGLAGRTVLQVKIDPDWAWNGRDVVRERLGVTAGSDGYFAFCTAALRDPDPPGRCPDCLRYGNAC